MTGTIPGEVEQLVNVFELLLQDNILEGSLSRVVLNLKKLSILCVQNNLLTGQLEGVFNPSTHLELTTIDASSNRFSGSLPAEMFRLPQLLVLSLSGA